jgi:hypothetical protein
MRWSAVALAVVGLLLLVPSVAPGDTRASVEQQGLSAHVMPFNTSVPAPSAVQTSTAGKVTYTTQVWNATATSSIYAGHPMAWTNVTFNPGTITAAFTASLTISSSVSGYIPRLLVTQGSTTLANTTSNLFLTFPLVGSTVVTMRIVSLQNLTGSAPNIGLYAVSLALRQSIQFDIVKTGSWTYNNTTYRLNWYVNASSGYWLNSTAISIPFLSGAVINVSSLSVSVNNTPGVYQLTPSAVYILLGPVAPAASDTIRVSFRPVPTILGKPPNIYLTQFTNHLGTYTGQTFYTNYLTPAYDGVFVIHVNFTGPVANLSVSANGYVFPGSQVSINGDNATLLPGALTAYLSQQFLFMVTFKAATAYASFPSNSLTLWAYGNTTITLGTTLLAGMGIDLLYVLALAIYGGPTYRRQFFIRRTAVRAVSGLWGPLLVLLLLVAFYLTASIAG